MPDNNDNSSSRRRITINSQLEPLSLQGNLAINWKKWYQSFKLYMTASELSEESEKRKVAVFLHMIGQDSLDIFNSFGVDENIIKLSDLVKRFEEYFVPKTNVTYESFKFFTRKQTQNESIDDFMTDLVNLSKTCEFGNLKERLITDIFICNLNENYQHVREKLLLETDLTPTRALHLAKTLITTQSQAAELNKEKQILYNCQENKPRLRGTSQSRSQSRKQYPHSHNYNGQSSNNTNSHRSRSRDNRQSQSYNHHRSASQSRNGCGKCGQIHRHKCPATHAKCRRCLKTGHYEALCKNKMTNFMEVTDYNKNEGENFFIGNLNSFDSSHWTITLNVNNINFECILDTGSDANVMSCDVYKSLKLSNKMSHCNAKVTSYSGNSVNIVGQQYINCQYSHNGNNVIKNILFIIADVKSPTVLGKHTCSELGLVKRIFNMEMSNDCLNLQSILTKYDSVFRGLGCLPGEIHLDTDPGVMPKIDAARKVPFSLHDKLKRELDNMEQQEVITKVTEPSSWVSSLVLVEKRNGKLRVCLDPRNLNQATKRSHYPIPTNDYIRSKLQGAAYFSTLDANSGFWMCKLDEESSFLCTFNTPFGRYRFKRLPYGINCAPEIFHRIMTEYFGVLPGVIVYADDILVYGATQAEHNVNLQRVFEKAIEVNLRFNKSKCVFGSTQVKYVGHVYSKEGVSPDPEKVRAIKDMPSPSCVKDLQRFLGILNYLGSFIQNMAQETEILRDLLKKSSDWQWNANHEATFSRLKQIICQTPVLAHFNVKKPIVLSVDASQSAVGAVLLQDNHPICYASKTMTSCQQRMAQIEKELYAIVFGCLRFHQYIYGQVVSVETDHRPLITLFKKPLAEVPTRLQRLMLKIQVYDLRVEYKPGSKMYIADSLSRAPLPESSEDELDENLTVHVNLLKNNLPISQERLEWLEKATMEDETMKLLKEYYMKGWPANKSQANQLVIPYWNYRDEIHVIGELLMKGNSLIIPTKLRPDILKMIHSGHQGIDKSKNFARGIVFWPLMSHDIQNIVESCTTCMSNRSSNPSEPLMPHKICDFPWQKVGIDYLMYKKQTIVVIEDYYSNFIEIAHVNSTNAKQLITVLKSIFSRFGIPVEIISDNGPPFNSTEFMQFVKEWGIEHTTTSPYMSKSNGLIESGVKIVKKILTKCDESGSDPYLAMLQYRTTARKNLPSPAQLLMSRTLRTQVPIHLKHLQPKVYSYKEYVENKTKDKQQQKFYYDKKVGTLPELHIGDSIWFKKTPEGKWLTGKIVEKCREPRSYIVESTEGNRYRRNRQHLRINKTTQLAPVSPRAVPQTVPVQREKKSKGRSNIIITESEIEQEKETGRGQREERGQNQSATEDVPLPAGNSNNSSHHSDSGSRSIIKTTRSGRQVKPPVRFKMDFEID